MIAPVEDLDKIMAVMDQAFEPSFGEAWNRRQVEDALVTGNCHYFLIGKEGDAAADDGIIAGFYLSRTGFGEEELLLLAVSPDHRRRGLATTMLEHLIASSQARGARRLLLEMRRGNEADTLYRSHGFEPIGERPNYYLSTDGQRIDAITFAKPIATETFGSDEN